MAELKQDSCDFEHPHDDHPCGRQIVDGITSCRFCGYTDGSSRCHCWTPATLEMFENDPVLVLLGRESPGEPS